MKKIIIKYIANTITDQELDALKLWLKKEKNQNTFEQYIKTSYDIDSAMNKPDLDAAYKKIRHSIDSKKKSKLRILPVWSRYAAAAVVVFMFSYIYVFDNKEQPAEVLNTFVTTVESGVDKATLTLDDGSNIILEAGTVYNNKTVASNGEEIIYKKEQETIINLEDKVETNKTESKIAYNYLTTPRGGEFQITLADGTQVWLNSETKLKYPTVFKKGETRQVELVYGEAYFDVSSSKNHNGATFKVISNLQEVEVFGTEFNIKAYKDEESVYTTLAEGKVAVSNFAFKDNLKVGQQSIISKSTGEIAIKTVNIYNETAWRLGSFSFKNKTLKEIMKVLSRWYDVDIVFENKKLETIKFNGLLSKKMTLEEILIPIKRSSNLNYTVNDSKIILK
ncbi:FecR family protein [Polaribacter sp. Z014]|uniref:FecR family protein n=1 Tax=Polaribacter sp. Z014 TaxID=2927126 RepID=UPI0020218D07|nr:FecR family protein [Polaribacter sp. Z014]MCL7764104.1 FecR family protein [Polaribacter sp. Z014]